MLGCVSPLDDEGDDSDDDDDDDDHDQCLDGDGGLFASCSRDGPDCRRGGGGGAEREEEERGRLASGNVKKKNE